VCRYLLNYKEFRSLTYLYISKKLKEKGKRLQDYFINEVMSNIIKASVESFSPESSFHFMKRIIETFDNYPKKNKKTCTGSVFACFNKKKKKEEFDIGKYNMRKVCSDIKRNYIDFSKKSFTQNELFEEGIQSEKSIICKFISSIQSSCEEKNKLLFEINSTEDRLKNEVDKYSTYFNIRKIIHKQENKMKTQKKRIEALDEARTINECIICMENERNVIFYPCLHLICCETCGYGKLTNDCPQCHAKIEQKKLILS
jgi:hypothetical protein